MVPPTRRTALQLLGTAGIASLTGCSTLSRVQTPSEQPPDALGTTWSPPDDDWRYPRQGLRNTARSAASVQAQPAVDWQVPATSATEADPESIHLAAVSQDIVVFGIERADGWVLTAHQPSDGTQRWRRQLEGFDSLPPQFGGLVAGTLYLTDFETDVLAVAAQDGTRRWRVNLYARIAESVPEQYLPEPDSSPNRFAPIPVATPDCVYVQTSYGVHGLSPEDGRERWRLYLGKELPDDRVLEDPGGLAVTDNRILLSYGRPEQLLFNIRQYSEDPVVGRRTVPIGSPAQPLVVDTDTTVLGSRVIWSTNTARTLASGTGRTRGVPWQFQGLASDGPAAFSTVASDGARVFVCEAHEETGEFAVFAIRADTGGLEWLHREPMSDNGIQVSSNTDLRVAHPAVADETVLAGYGVSSEAGSDTGLVLALSTATGTMEWRIPLEIAPRDIAPTETGIYISGHNSDGGGFSSNAN